MEDFFDDQNNQGFFESFSDVALCTLTVTLVLLSLLATSVRQSLNITLNENQFNQASKRSIPHPLPSNFGPR